MEENKQSASSLTSDLFGSKESSGSSHSTPFGSIFASPSKDAVLPEAVNKKQDPKTQLWNDKGTTPNSEFASQWTKSKETTSPIYQDHVPSSLFSSIHYGGQDNYPLPQTNKSECSTLKIDIADDDQGSINIGNWWKGSFYY